MNDLSTSGRFGPPHDNSKPVFLADLDGVTYDMELLMYEIWADEFPDRPLPDLSTRKSFYVSDELSDPSWRGDLHEIICRPNFFLNLPLMPGAQEAIAELNQLGSVFFCTSPMISNPYCAQEKMLAIERDFGEAMVYRTIITKDKTAVRGNVLFDDRPEVEGIMEPTWEHAVFGQPYNSHLVDVPGIIRVADWEEGVFFARRYADDFHPGSTALQDRIDRAVRRHYHYIMADEEVGGPYPTNHDVTLWESSGIVIS